MFAVDRPMTIGLLEPGAGLLRPLDLMRLQYLSV